MSQDFDSIRRRVLGFRDEREWRQFHDPKNLADAVSIEAAELLEIFLWSNPRESTDIARKELDRVREEVADIGIFLVYLCEEVGIDLLEAIDAKLRTNELKYPATKARGRSAKYREL